MLSHDRLAEAVVRAVAEEGGRLDIDGELLRLRNVVTHNLALYREKEFRQAKGLDRR